MYDNPAHIRDREIKVRLNDAEFAVISALANYNQRERAAFVRELLMASVALAERQGSDQLHVA